MDDKLVDRLLTAMRETDEDDEVFCDETQAMLGAYVERELVGENIAAAMPRVTTHLQRCLDCREEYESLRDLLATFDPALLPAPAASAAPLLASSPLQNPAGDPIAELLAWAQSQIAIWRQSLPSLGLALRSSRRDLDPVPIPGLELATSVQLSISQRGPSFELAGVFRPAAPALHQRAVRLYRVGAVADTISVLSEESISTLDRFRFRGVVPGQYVLTVDLPGGEVGLAHVTLGESPEG